MVMERNAAADRKPIWLDEMHLSSYVHETIAVAFRSSTRGYSGTRAEALGFKPVTAEGLAHFSPGGTRALACEPSSHRQCCQVQIQYLSLEILRR